MGGSYWARGAGSAFAACWWLGSLLPAQGIAKAVAAAEQLHVRTGVAAMELDGSWRYRHRADERFTPASNMKLVTAAAVLAGLGRDYAFHTAVELRSGRLVVHAGGDPNWIVDTDTAPDALYRGIVAALQQRGIGAIAGIDLDDGAFTGPTRPPTWPQDQLDTYYCAPTGGLVLQQGTFVVRLQPSGGAVAATLMAPMLRLPIEGSVELGADRKKQAYGASDRGDSIRVQGRMSQGAAPVEIRVAVRDPAAWFQRALAQALEAGGIATRADARGDVPELYVHRTPLRPALQRMLEDSSNFDAEQLARVLGAEHAGDGSLAGGVAAVGKVVRERIGALGDLVQIDGSGLSRGNEVTPELLVAVLRAVANGHDGEVFFAALPLAGSSGTLAERFVHSPVAGRVRAKTGWIRGASALSGVLTRRDGSRCAFAILMNYDPAQNGLNRQLKAIQEQIVEALDAGEAG